MFTLSLFTFDFYFSMGSGVGVIIASLFLLSRYKVRFEQLDLPYLVCALFISLYIVIGVSMVSHEYGVVINWFKVVLAIVAVKLYLRNVYTKDDFIRSLAWIWILQAVYVVFVFIDHEIYQYGSILRVGGSHLEYTYPSGHYLRFRLYPASGQLVSGLAVIAGFTFIILFNEMTAKVRRNSTIFLFFAILSVFFIGLLSGRTFLLFIIFSFVILFIRSPLKLFFYGLLGCCLIVVYFFSSGGFDNTINRWAFEPLYNFMYYGDIASASTDNLMERHLFIPDFDFLMSHSFSFKSDGEWAAGTDSGLLRYLYLGGPVYLFLIISLLGAILIDKRSVSGFAAVLWPIIALIILVKQEFTTNASAVALYIMSYHYISTSILNNGSSPKLVEMRAEKDSLT